MQEEIIRTRWGTAIIDRSQVPDDPAENARRKKELYHICVRAIMNLPPDRRQSTMYLSAASMGRGNSNGEDQKA